VRRLTKSLLLTAAILLAGCLVAACGRSGGGAIANFSPSRSASITPTSPSPSITPPSPSASTSPPSPSPSATAQPSSTQSAIASATSAQSSSPPATSSGTSSSLIWLWVVIGALALIGVIVWIARASGRRSAVADEWQSRVVDAYAKSAALYDSMRAAETPGALAAEDAGARWSDLQRRTDDLTQLLYALREVAPDEDKRARVSDVLASVQGARVAMDAERAPGGADGRNAQVVRSRLLSLNAAIRALRAPDEPHL
jgi:hypothetical protein